jgi:predicted transcriptional regulator
LENLCKLLFELSSSERMNVMLELQRQRLKLSQVSKKLDMTVTEASRHLQRLCDSMLVRKDVDGLFEVTKLGELVIQLLSAPRFILDNKQYFMEHDVSVLPYEFINRIGELSVSSLQTDIISNFAYEEKMLQAAEEFSWAMSNQVHWNAPPIITERMKRGVKLRSIIPENIVPPTGYRPASGVERRTMPSVDLRIILTDKEAMFGLPLSNGKMDYTQFLSRDPKFLRWCKDLFLYYWEKAEPLSGGFPHLK